MLLPQRKTYKGIVQLQGGSITSPGKDTRKFSIICIGRQELHNIEVSRYFEQLLVQGEEIELTLTCASFASFICAVVGGILYYTGKTTEFNELVIIGPVIFMVSIFYWFWSLINSGHGIYSIKANDKLYRGNAGVPHEAAVSPVTASPTGVQYGVQYEVSAPSPAQSPEKNEGLSRRVEKHTEARELERAKKSALPASFNSRIPGVSKLACPQCDTEALVVPETRIICGDCKVPMQVDRS